MDWKKLLNEERPRKSTSKDEHRSQFERDFDRAVFSTPVRRMQDKAQVFPLEPHDSVRTRLTHSLEVSSVARGIAIAVTKWLIEENKIKAGMERSIEAIAATSGLVHDLGNPPFGHAGEDAIREWFQKRFVGETKSLVSILGNEDLAQDFIRFEGNAQSLRLLSKLQILADYHGLNLTYGTLSGCCKYIAAASEANSEAENHALRKPGYFTSEKDLVKAIRDKTGTGDARNPIAYIVEAADDIVYSVADVEDAVKKGIRSWKQVVDHVEADDCFSSILKRKEKILSTGETDDLSDLPDDVHVSAFRTAVITEVVLSVIEVFREKYESIMNGNYNGSLVSDCEARQVVTSLKDLAIRHVYCTGPNLRLELMGRTVIQDLMDIFWEGAQACSSDKPPKTKSFGGKAGALLSENYRRVFQNAVKANSLPESYCRLQLVTDYVCGMTDSFAKRLHAELKNGC